MGSGIEGQSTGLMHPATQLPATAETASSAVAAQARAAVESRYKMALLKPRHELTCRSKLLEACKRPTFAESARYSKPIGKDFIEGFSIRFAEEAARAWTNILLDSIITYDDDTKRLGRVTATDLESNVSWSVDFIIAKTVERKFVKEGQTVIARRTNAKGEQVNIVAATDDDMLTKTNAHVSKAARTAVLRLIPGDMLDDAEQQLLETMKDEDKKDPAAAAKKLADLFFALGITSQDVETYIGQPLAHLTPANLAWLRAVYHTIKQGEGTWAEIVAAGNPAGTPAKTATVEVVDRSTGEVKDVPAPAAAPAEPQTRTSGLRDKIAKKAEAAAGPPITEESTAALLEIHDSEFLTADERGKITDALGTFEKPAAKPMTEKRALVWIAEYRKMIDVRAADTSP